MQAPTAKIATGIKNKGVESIEAAKSLKLPRIQLKAVVKVASAVEAPSPI